MKLRQIWDTNHFGMVSHAHAAFGGAARMVLGCPANASDKPKPHYLMLTSPIKGTPTESAVLVSDEYLGSLVGLE